MECDYYDVFGLGDPEGHLQNNVKLRWSVCNDVIGMLVSMML